MAVMRALGLQSLLPAAAAAAAPSCLKSLCSWQRSFLLRNSPSLTQSGRVLKSRFLSSRRSLQGACLTSPVAAGAATLAVVTASTSQQVTPMAPGQGIQDEVGDGAQLPDLMTEFMVDMKCEGCVESVRTKVEPLHGVKSVDLSLENQVVRILGSATLKNLTTALVESGRNARLIGQGVPEKFALTAAVAEFKGPHIHGVVRIAQVSMELVRIEASFNGLTPGSHGWSINEYGDLTHGASSTGGIFNGSAESKKPDGLPAGDLGVLEVTNEGSAEYTGTKEMLLVGDLIGRALVVYGDLDKSRPGITAAVIARSACVGENYKKLCSCDGTVIWESTNSDYVKAQVIKELEQALGSPLDTQPQTSPQNPLVIVISGPSGVGKDAVIKRLQEVRQEIHFVVTATTRPRRPSEIEGVDYYFVTKPEFQDLIARNELLEHAVVYGDYKGIPKKQVRDCMSTGQDVVLRLDIQGAATVRKILGQEAVFIFMVAESELALVERLVERKTESIDKLVIRVATARDEVKHMTDFDYVVVNADGQLERTVSHLCSIIDAEKARVHQRHAQF